MIRAGLRLIILMAFVVVIVTACGGGGGGSSAGNSSKNSTINEQGTLVVSSVDNATRYTVFNAFNSSTPSSSGSFSATIATNAPTYTYAISSDGTRVYMTVSNADGSNITAVSKAAATSNMTIDTQSTAEAMVLLSPLLIPSTSAERANVVNIVQSDASVKTLATVIENVYGDSAVQDPLSDPRISDALTNAIESVLTTWQTSLSAKAALRQSVRKSSVLASVIATSYGSSIMIYPTSDIGALTLAGSTGSTLHLGIASAGPAGITTNVDWVVRIVELDPSKIQWTSSGVPGLGDSTNIDNLIKPGGFDKTTVIEGSVASGMLNFAVDPIGQVATSIHDSLFPNAGINLPDDGVYAVIALSGSPFGNSAQYTSVMSSTWQQSLWEDAAGLNIMSVAIDVVGTGTSFASAAGVPTPDISTVLEGERATIESDLQANPNYLDSAPNFIGLAVDLTGKLLDQIVPSIFSTLNKSQSSILKELVNLPVKATLSVVNVWSGSVEASSRILNYIYSVTPRESAFAVLAGSTIPSAPTGLSATAGNNQVALSWTAPSGATSSISYNVYRGTTSGALSTKTEIASGINATSYTDTTAANGTTYYYQVTAVYSTSNAVGETQGSNEVSATPSYTLNSITGTVTFNGAGLSGVTLSLSGAATSSAITSSSGVYGFSVAGGSYTVTPALTGYTFSPSSLNVTINGANVTGENFTASSATTTTYTETVLHSFAGGADGGHPYAGLIMDASGNLYGTTSSGGADAGGTVFKLAPNGSGGYMESVPHSFTGGSDGGGPYAGLIIDSAGNLYGTTSGGASGYGTVFKLAPNGSGGYTETTLYTFTGGSDGANSYAGLIMDTSGNLYGTTSGGGSGYGTVFKLAPNGSGGYTETTLHAFTGQPDGANSYAGLIMDTSGNLYGTTYGGGASGNGAVFKLAPNGSGGYTESVLYSFAGQPDGAKPQAGLIIDSAGNLYGTTGAGGSSGYYGTVFKLAPNGSGGYTESVLHSFTGGSDGAGPYAGLIMDSGGNLYGTTEAGGGSGYWGTVFKLAPNGNGGYTESVLHSFAGGSDGAEPTFAGLINDASGNLYGTTSGGEVSNDYGTVFKLTPQ